MAAATQLEIQGDTTTFTLAVEGAFFPRLDAEYKPGSQPREIVALRETWEVRGCQIVTADGTVASTWSQFVALRARIGVRSSAFPTYARFVIPGGATLHTLGPSTHEDFQIDGVDGEQDPNVAAASWRSTATFTLRFSAVSRYADTNGIVGWTQEIENTYADGRHQLTWRTRLSTAEGTSALTKARSYAALTSSIVAALGSTYLYVTNGPYGIETVETDADEENTRTPTAVEVVSSVRAYGVTIGAVSPGSAPSDVGYSITTRTTPDETVTTTVAEATGPGALAFVMAKRPAVFNEEEILDEQARYVARGTWSQRRKATKDAKLDILFSLKATLAGGGRAIDIEAVADGGEPVEFVGAFQPVVAAVDVSILNSGVTERNEDMKLPGPPGDPWLFDAAASTETQPFPETRAASVSESTWRREAHLVFRARKAPTTSILQAMLAAQPVDSYVYPAAAG